MEVIKCDFYSLVTIFRRYFLNNLIVGKMLPLQNPVLCPKMCSKKLKIG